MQWSDLSFRPGDRTLRQFAFLGVVFFGGLSLWQAIFHLRVDVALLLASLGLAIGVVGWLRPQAIRFVYVPWLAATFPMAWLTSRLVLILLYYGVITPIGLVLRIFGRDVLRLRARPEQESYWQSKPNPDDTRSYFHQF